MEMPTELDVRLNNGLERGLHLGDDAVDVEEQLRHNLEVNLLQRSSLENEGNELGDDLLEEDLDMRLEVRDEAQQAVDVDLGKANCLDCIGGQCVSHRRG